jgi:hypothetical protein
VTHGKLKCLVLAVALVCCAAPASAGGAGKSVKRADAPAKAKVSKEMAELEAAVDSYKVSLQNLMVPLEQKVAAKAARVEKIKSLLEANIVSRKEVDDADRELAAAQTELADAKKQLGEADLILEEAIAARQLALTPPRGGYSSTAAIMRYGGAGAWHISEIGRVQSFFTSHFGRVIPISAYGQTGLHDRLGFDHSNAVDVAVHPDSAEGQALISYLRGAGIPFLAFRGAIPGKATGPHIHIGYPSHHFR